MSLDTSACPSVPAAPVTSTTATLSTSSSKETLRYCSVSEIVGTEGNQVTAEPATNMDPRVARTRATVLGAAIDLLAERGYSGFSVESVVERTGIAKTTLYRHWPTRDDLLAAAIAKLDGAGPLPDAGSVRQDIQDLLARRVQAARTPQWERCMPALVEAAARHPELAAMIARL